jgi:transposase
MKKATNFNQKETVLQAFEGNSKSMLMVAKITGVERANITRYIAKFKKHGQITLIGFSACKISGYLAGFYKVTDHE